MLTFKEVNAAIQKLYPHVKLVQGKGYLYITSDDEETSPWISGMYTTSIPVYKLNHFPDVDSVVSRVVDLIKNDINDSYLEYQREKRKFNSNPGLDREELVQAMLGTNQFKRKEMQKAAARIRNRLRNKPKE